MTTGTDILSVEPSLSQLSALKGYRATLEGLGKKVSDKQKSLLALGMLFSAKPASWGAVSELGLEIVSNNQACIILSEGLAEQVMRASLSLLNPWSKTSPGFSLKIVGSSLGNEHLQRICSEVRNRPVSIIVVFYDDPSPRLLWCYRLLYSALAENRYAEELKRRVVIAAGEPGSKWGDWAKNSGFRTLTFPSECGGRYLFFSEPVALVIELTGFSAWQCVEGGRSYIRSYDKKGGLEDPVLAYSALREIQLTDGLQEVLAVPDHTFQNFSQWWELVSEDSRQAFSDSFLEASVTLGAVVSRRKVKDRRQWVTRVQSEAEKGLHASSLDENSLPPWPQASPRSWAPLEDHYERITSAQYAGPGYGQPCPLLRIRRLDASCIGALFAFFEAMICTCHQLADIDERFSYLYARQLEGESEA